MKDGQPNFYAIIPANVRYAKDLSELQKLLYAEITALSDKHGYCFASNSYFAKLYNKTAKWISSTISDMSKKGYLVLDKSKEDGRTRKIFIGEVKKLRKQLQVPIPEKKEAIPVETDTPIPLETDTISQKNGNITIQDNTTSVNSVETPPPHTHKNIDYINGMRDIEIRGNHRIKIWNEKTGKGDLMNSEIKKSMYDIMKNVTADEFQKRVDNYVMTLLLIDKFKLRSYLFFQIWDFDIVMFFTHINKFYGEIPTILSKLAKNEYKTKIVNMIKEPSKQEVQEIKTEPSKMTDEQKKELVSKLRSKMEKINKLN